MICALLKIRLAEPPRGRPPRGSEAAAVTGGRSAALRNGGRPGNSTPMREGGHEKSCPDVDAPGPCGARSGRRRARLALLLVVTYDGDGESEGPGVVRGRAARTAGLRRELRDLPWPERSGQR